MLPVPTVVWAQRMRGRLTRIRSAAHERNSGFLVGEYDSGTIPDSSIPNIKRNFAAIWLTPRRILGAKIWFRVHGDFTSRA
jgi:hypothetical protein